MNILLLGNMGQLGWELNRSLLTLGALTALDYPQIDMTSADNIHSVISQTKPHVILNATAYTDVDRAETQQDLALSINAVGPGILAQEARKIGAALIHYSTDYIFDGTNTAPYKETDIPSPIHFYAHTKLAGEQAVQDAGGTYLILRTSWMYSLRRPCFLTKVLQWAKNSQSLSIVDDQVSNPTWARMLAEATANVLAQGNADVLAWLNQNHGIYHVASCDYCSRYDWALEILRLLDQDVQVQKAKSTEFPTPALRPLFSALDCTKFMQTFNIQLPPWRQSLSLALAEL